MSETSISAPQNNSVSTNPSPTSFIQAERHEEPDKATGLTGWAKIVTQVGAVGFCLVILGWVLWRADFRIGEFAAREDRREDAAGTRFTNAINTISDRHREDARAIVDTLKENHSELREIRRLLVQQNNTGVKVHSKEP